jgi:hypothetical protein
VTPTAGYNPEGDGSVVLTWSTGPALTGAPEAVVIEPRFTG